MEQSLMEKLTILADSAKYDVACTSSGASRAAKAGSMGSCYAPGCCHAFTADGRCVSLLKVLMTNCCAFDCSYCVNRRSNDAPRATFSPWELAELTIEFYRRNYIEGLFLSSAVLVSPDYTTERMLKTLRLLRNEFHFGGYIHAKAIPGTSPELLEQLGFLADRLSVNVELPSESSLKLLAPDKGRHSIFRPMKQIAVEGAANREELTLYRKAPRFASAGQSTQMIVGASPETDHHILKLTEGMYQKYSLKRVFYSAYIPVAEDTRLPALDTKPPLLREHRLYQADWLLRFYQFKADEILDAEHPNFNPYLDPKCNWAVQHYGLFPVDVNRAPFEMLLRVPGIGPKSARRIWRARKQAALGLDEQPTVHEGSQARNLELQGIKADRCELNRQIRADNKLLRELKAQLAKLSKAVENTVEHIAETLERLRSSLIMLQYRLLVNNKQVDTWKRQVNYYRPILQDYHAVTQQLADKKSEQEQLQTTRNTASLLQIAQRRQLAEQIAALTEKIEELRSRQAMILHNLDCKNNSEAQRFGSYLDKLEEMQEKLAAQRESLTQQLSATIKQYLEIENMIQPEDEDSVRQRRTALRPDVAFEREQQLSHNGYIDNISIQIAQQIVDVQIVGDKISEKVQTSMAQHKEVPDR